ncbi:hypothetical protein [Actinotalea solisilvae]|uniref:hypothetical protein n=1 Tax=Actinotalea solisilvae TaxID=2072922 RepID=UPI0018F1B085|nr:hypothetical protein [Actinotalea solisilvae]
MPTSLLLAKQGTVALAHSAEPGAPVVEDRPRRARRTAGRARAVRTRSALAGALHRVADAVAPAPDATAH